MKSYIIIGVVAVVSMVASCKKYNDGKHEYDPPLRKVRYELYTPDNVTGDERNITFRLFMRTNRRTILDSSLPVMKIKDIPDFAHRLIIEKTVPGSDTSSLVVGFINYFEGVGVAWKLEDFPAVNTYKVVVWSYRP